LPSVKRLLGRVPAGLPPQLITAFSALGFRLNRKLRQAADQGQICDVLVEESSAFCRQVVRHGLGAANAVYSFNGAGLELLQYAKSNGLFAVMEQTIAPMRVEVALMQTERQRHPCWEEGLVPGKSVAAFINREEAEWRYADLILCGSDFVRDGVRQCGGPVDKCVVVPYGLDGTRFRRTNSAAVRQPGSPLKVLTVGAAGLRKGTPYVLEAARQLKGKAIFRWVGECSTATETVRDASVDFVGVIPRSEVNEQFKWADVFLLPSICEGSAMVTYEALAAGLPIICTPSSGSVVKDRKQGLLVPSGSSEAIVRALTELISSSDLHAELARNAEQLGSELTLATYEGRLIRELCGAYARQGAPEWS
jgi:glycosyltransferase involved in cell wall biosynthesis